MKKRLLSLFLVITMVFGLIPASVFAVGTTDPGVAAVGAPRLAAGQVGFAKDSCTVIGSYEDNPVYYLDASGNADATSVVFTDFTADDIMMIAGVKSNEMVMGKNEAPLAIGYSKTKDTIAEDTSWVFDAAHPLSGLGDNLYAYWVCLNNFDEFYVIVNAYKAEAPAPVAPDFTASVNGVAIAPEKIEKQEGAYEYTMWVPDAQGKWNPEQRTMDLYVVPVPAGTAAVDFTFTDACLAYGYDDDKNTCTEGMDEYSGGYVGKTTATRSVDKDGDGNMDFVTVQSPYDASNMSISFYAISFRAPAWKGEGTEQSPYELATPKDLTALSDYVSSGKPTEGLYYKVVADITLPDGWRPIGVLKDPSVGHIDRGKNLYAFSGTIDGEKADGSGCYTISVPAGGLPLLAYVKGATVKNLNIYGPRIEGYGLINNMEGVGLSGSAVIIDNVTLKSGTQTLKSGLVGSVLTNNRFAGVSGSFVTTIRDCTVEEGCVIGYNADQSEIGSFAGRLQGTIENCVSHATVKGKDSVGGIIGSRDNSMGKCIVTNCQFDGTVEGTKNVGGIVGSGYTGAFASNGVKITVNNCKSGGTVKGTENVGGIIGGDEKVVQPWNAYSLKDNRFTGKVSGTKNVGGIIGYYGSLNKHDDITGNAYSDKCGADKGIGFVMYVDTSCQTHETESGATYINTANGKPGISGITKKDLNRTDDPLGKDADNLCRAESVPVTATELKVSGDYKKEYITGESLDLSGVVLTVVYSDGSTKSIPLDDVTVSEFDAQKVGEQKLTVSYEGLSAMITVQVKNPQGQIQVTVSLLGDSAHGDDGTVHTLSGGGLTTWVSPVTRTADANATVWQVLKQLLDEKGYSYANPSGNYVETINGLSGFSNGANSGWMFTLNGVYTENGVGEQGLTDGDVIVFHYTDDYTKESDGTGEDDGNEDAEAAEKVEALIVAIGTVTLDSGDKIHAARAAYDALTADQKKQVGNYAALTAAEYQLTLLKDPAAYQNAYKATGDHLGQLGTPGVGSLGGEWMVIGLARSGRSVPAGYYDAVVKYVKEHINDKEQLHRATSTDNSRMILALTSLGYDVTDVAGHNLLVGLSDMSYIKKQGINGPIWALIAFDSHNYAIPAGNVTRDALIGEILNAQLSDGGWALSGVSAEPDMTAMAVQALAPYYGKDAKVKSALDSALNRLSALQTSAGGYLSEGTPNSESCAQVLVALTALGIDPQTDARFIKNGCSVLSALMAFYTDGGFRHTLDSGRNGMATEQGYYALASYARLKENKTRLYDMSDVTVRTGEKPSGDGQSPQTGDNSHIGVYFGLMTVSLAGLAVIAVSMRRKKYE